MTSFPLCRKNTFLHGTRERNKIAEVCYDKDVKKRTKIQIDQSGKIEQTNLNTIIALSNNMRYSLVLPKKVKRILQEIFRKQQRPRMFIYDTFAALIALVLIKTKPLSKILIDKEYKNEDLIKARILEFLKKHNKIKFNPDIEFTLVGKSSPAHILAAKVANKKIIPNLVVSLEDIVAFLWPIKKTGYSAINRTEGYLTQDWLPGDQKPSQPSISRKYHKITRKSIKKR